MGKRGEPLDRVASFAGLGLAIGGGLALFVLGQSLYYYALTGQRQLTGSAYGIVYYLLPLAAAVSLLVASRLAPANRVNLFLLLVTSSLSVCALELLTEWRTASLSESTRPVMSTLANAKNKPADAAALEKQWGQPIDIRSAEEVLASLRAEPVDPVAITTPSNHLFITGPDGRVESAIAIDGREVMPLAGISNRNTLLCNDGGQWIHYRSDRHGFNNANPIWQLDHLDLAAIGDSFAHGYCVPAEQNFVALLRQQYPATINLGIAGDGPLLMLATLTEYLPSFKPRIVLWFYFEGNDLSELQNESTSRLLGRYLTDGFSQDALRRQADIDQAILDQMPRLKALEQSNRATRLDRHPLDRVTTVAKLSALREQLGLVGGVYARERSVTGASNMEALRNVLAQAQARVRGWGGQLVFVYLPDWSRYAGYTPPAGQKQSEVLAIARSLGMATVDIDSAFEAHGDPLSLFPFRRAGHYNEAGHRVVAEAVLQALSQNEPRH